MKPCWALMAVFDRPLLGKWDAAFVNEGPLSWVSGQASRPDRPGAHAWVLHASPDWSLSHLEEDGDCVTRQLLDAARRLPGASTFETIQCAAHRWRYARAVTPIERTNGMSR